MNDGTSMYHEALENERRRTVAASNEPVRGAENPGVEPAQSIPEHEQFVEWHDAAHEPKSVVFKHPQFGNVVPVMDHLALMKDVRLLKGRIENQTAYIQRLITDRDKAQAEAASATAALLDARGEVNTLRAERDQAQQEAQDWYESAKALREKDSVVAYNQVEHQLHIEASIAAKMRRERDEAQADRDYTLGVLSDLRTTLYDLSGREDGSGTL